MHAVEGIGSHLQHCSLPSVEVLRPAVISASTGSGRLDDAAPAATETPRGPRPEHQSGGRSGRVGHGRQSISRLDRRKEQ